MQVLQDEDVTIERDKLMEELRPQLSAATSIRFQEYLFEKVPLSELKARIAEVSNVLDLIRLTPETVFDTRMLDLCCHLGEVEIRDEEDLAQDRALEGHRRRLIRRLRELETSLNRTPLDLDKVRRKGDLGVIRDRVVYLETQLTRVATDRDAAMAVYCEKAHL